MRKNVFPELTGSISATLGFTSSSRPSSWIDAGTSGTSVRNRTRVLLQVAHLHRQMPCDHARLHRQRAGRSVREAIEPLAFERARAIGVAILPRRQHAQESPAVGELREERLLQLLLRIGDQIDLATLLMFQSHVELHLVRG